MEHTVNVPKGELLTCVDTYDASVEAFVIVLDHKIGSGITLLGSEGVIIEYKELDQRDGIKTREQRLEKMRGTIFCDYVYFSSLLLSNGIIMFVGRDMKKIQLVTVPTRYVSDMWARAFQSARLGGPARAA